MRKWWFEWVTGIISGLITGIAGTTVVPITAGIIGAATTTGTK